MNNEQLRELGDETPVSDWAREACMAAYDFKHNELDVAVMEKRIQNAFNHALSHQKAELITKAVEIVAEKRWNLPEEERQNTGTGFHNRDIDDILHSLSLLDTPTNLLK